MKLKKIASLALAGVMAVSMLAGCSNGSNGNSNSGNTTVSSIVEAVNNGQKSYNDVKITFTANSKLEDAAKKAVALYGENIGNSVATADNIQNAIAQYASIVNSAENFNNFGDKNTVTTTVKDGDVHTYFDLILLGSSEASNEYLMNAAAKVVDSMVAGLAKTTLVTEEENAASATKPGEDYLDYSYTGNVCLVSVPYAAGLTNYYMAVVIEQTVTVNTYEKA